MKRVVILLVFLSVSVVNAQAFKGKGDVKFQVGANIQHDGTGIMASLDYGLGENISIGVASSYLLGVNQLDNGKLPEFEDRFDIKARFNANLGNVINVDDGLSSLEDADFDKGAGNIKVVGTCELNYHKVRCIADVNLKTKKGKGYLEVLDDESGEPITKVKH